MRSVVHVDSDVLDRARQLADERGVGVEVVVEQAISELVLREHRTAETAPVDLPTFGGRGVRPGIDLDRNSSVLDVMDQDGPV